MPRSYDALDALEKEKEKSRLRSSGSVSGGGNGNSGGSLLFAAPISQQQQQQQTSNSTNDDNGGYYAPPAYSHTTNVPGTYRHDSLLAPANNPDNVSYSSSEAEQSGSVKRKGRGRIGDNNPLPAEELADTPVMKSPATGAADAKRPTSPHHGNNKNNTNSNRDNDANVRASYSSPKTSFAAGNDRGSFSNSYRNNNANTSGRSPSSPQSPSARNNNSPRLDGKRASNIGGGGNAYGSRQSNLNNNNGNRNSTRYSKRGESNLNGGRYGDNGDGSGQSPRVSNIVETIKDVSEQFVDIVKNKSKRHLRSHDELTMSPFQKFVHYGRFPCKLLLSTLIVILITVLIFTFELPNSLNDENERKQLIDLFMDAIDVEGASGRREPGEDYTFVPKLFLSTQESVLEAMANVGQLYYNITRESLCDLDFFFNDAYDDFPRNVTIQRSAADGMSSWNERSGADSSSTSATTVRRLLSLEEEEKENINNKKEAENEDETKAKKKPYRKPTHPSLKNIVKSPSTDSNLPAELHPEKILSDVLRSKWSSKMSKEAVEASRARNRDGRILSHKGGAPTLDQMGSRAAGRWRQNGGGKQSNKGGESAAAANAFGRFFMKDAMAGKSSHSSSSSSASSVPPPRVSTVAADGTTDVSGTVRNRIYFPAMRGPRGGFSAQSSISSHSSNTNGDGGFNTGVSSGKSETVYFNSYYDYVRHLFISGQVEDPFFINSTWVQPPTLTINFMRSSPRVDWAAANAETRAESYAVTLDNLLGPFILAPDAVDGSSEPTPGDELPVWSYAICAPRADPLFEGHFFLPCRDSIDQDNHPDINQTFSGERPTARRLTSRKRLPGSTSSVELGSEDGAVLPRVKKATGGPRTSRSGSNSVRAVASKQRMARRNKKAAKYFKALAEASNTDGGVALSSDAAAGGKRAYANALANRKRRNKNAAMIRSSGSSSSRGFSAQAIDGDADRLFTPFGIFDTTDDAVIDMYIHQLFTASNSKTPQFSDLFYQDSIYVWHVRVYFDLDTNGLATVTVEVDNQVRRNHSSFQTIFFLLLLLLIFAVWDACLRVRGLNSIINLKRMIRKRLESLRREQVRRAWSKAREQEENAFGTGGVQRLFANKSNRDDRDAFDGFDSSNGFVDVGAELHHANEEKNAQAARAGGLLSVTNANNNNKKGNNGTGVGSNNDNNDSGSENEQRSLINTNKTGATSANATGGRAETDSTTGASYTAFEYSNGEKITLKGRFVRAWNDLFGIIEKRTAAADIASAARTGGPANPNAFIHPITQKVLTDYEIQQLERKCRKSLRSDAGMSWQFLAIICDILAVVYVCFAIAQATSLTVTSSAVRMERIILGVAGLFSSILLVSYLRFFPKFYFMIRATSAALPRVILFYIGVLPIFFAFAIFWVTVFGSYSKGQFDSLTRSIATLYCCMFGDNLLPTFQAAMNNDSYEIYFLGAFVTFAFIAFFMFAVLNLTMSIVMDSFDNVKEKYGLQVDDPSQQYLQYGSKGVMAMKAAEQKQIEAVREIREQLGVIAKTLPIINGGKSKRAERKNKAKEKLQRKMMGGNTNGGQSPAESPGLFSREDGEAPPHLSISPSEAKPKFKQGNDGKLLPPNGSINNGSSGSAATASPPISNFGGVSNPKAINKDKPRQAEGTFLSPVQAPIRSPSVNNNDNEDDDEDGDLDDEAFAIGENEATQATKARFENRYHEFMMEPGLDGDVLDVLGAHYAEGDENHGGSD